MPPSLATHQSEIKERKKVGTPSLSSAIFHSKLSHGSRFQKDFVFFSPSCSFCPSAAHLGTCLCSFFTLSPFYLPPCPSSWDVSRRRGSVLTALHSANCTSSPAFPPVHHCWLPRTYALNIKPCVAGKPCRVGWVHLAVPTGISPCLMISLALSLCKLEQLVKQREAVIEEDSVFPWCKSTTGAFEYCIIAHWLCCTRDSRHLHPSVLMCMCTHTHTNAPKCSSKHKPEHTSHTRSHPRKVMRLSCWCSWKFGGLRE